MKDMQHDHDFGTMISRYIDKELSTQEKGLIEDHLRGCHKCKNTYEQFVSNDKIVSDSLKFEVFGNQLIEGVMKKVKSAVSKDKTSLFTYFLMRYMIKNRKLLFILPLLLCGSVIVYSFVYINDLKGEIAGLKKTVKEQSSYIAFAQRSLDNMSNVSARKTLKKFVDNHTSDIAARYNKNYISIAASLKGSNFEFFKIYKRKNNGKWFEIGTVFESPEFTDYETSPGVYEYYFEGFMKKKNGAIESVKSSIIRHEIDGSGLNIDFISHDEITDKSTFTLRENGKTIRTVTLKTGEFLDSAIRLESVSKLDRIITVIVPTYILDEETGRPIIDPTTGKPKVQGYSREPVAQGSKSYKARFRNVKTQETFTVWLGEQREIVNSE